MNAARRILIVEDEETLVLTLGDRLRSEGYEVEVARDGDCGLERASREPFDLLLLDIALPGRDGLDVCRQLRQHGATLPILMLTARAQVFDRVVGLRLGADDYLTKPFEMIELLARVEALLRRGAPPPGAGAAAYSFGDVRVDFRSAEVRRGGALLELSALEFKLLRYLIEHRGALVSRGELLEKVWGYESLPQTRTVDVHVASLRQKIEAQPSRPQHIVTVHRLGYRFTG